MLNPSELENALLLKQFHDFYSTVIGEKRQIESMGQGRWSWTPAKGPSADETFAMGATESEAAQTEPGSEAGSLTSPTAAESASEAPSAPPGPPAAGKGTAEPAPPDELEVSKDAAYPVHVKLFSLLEQQTHEARRYGGEYGVRYYKDAQYVMAALGDEIFLLLKWEGQESWKLNLLEFRLFGTHTAGDLFFQKLDTLLKERDPSMVEIAAVYLLSLSLGFRGKYRDIDDEGQLDYYRNQLFTFIFKKNPDIDSESKRLFAESYDHTLGKGKGERLPYLRSWIGLIVLLIILYLIVSHVIWIQLSDDLMQVVEQILKEIGMF